MAKNIDIVIKKVLKKIRPSVEEQRRVKELSKMIMKAGRKFSDIYGMKPMLCGSVAKNTWLLPAELDLFLLFPENLPKKKLEEYGLKVAKDIIKEMKGKYKISYSEHPYLTGVVKYRNSLYAIDIVPCYNIKGGIKKIKSAVDRTPYHVKYILKNLKNPDEVRLLKKFCIARECYGADLKVQGFSGYLCELLVVKFGSFINVVRNATQWRAGVFLGKGEKSLEFERSALILPDPVDKNRNVASALSIETFYRFVKSCKEFLKNPDESFFEKDAKKPYTISEIKNKIKSRGTTWYAIRFKKPDVGDDILYSQMRKFLSRIRSMANEEEFKIFRIDFYVGSKYCVAVIEMETWMLPGLVKHVGPDVFSKHAEEFLKHYKQYNVFLEDNKWVVEYPRENKTFIEFLKQLLKGDLKKKGIPSRIAPALKYCEVFSGEKFIELVKKMPESFRVFMREYFEKNLNVSD